MAKAAFGKGRVFSGLQAFERGPFAGPEHSESCPWKPFEHRVVCFPYCTESVFFVGEWLWKRRLVYDVLHGLGQLLA